MLITEMLNQRPQREPDHAGENRALIGLSEAMTEPEGFLQALVESVLDVCGAESAGASVLESSPEGDVIRTKSIAGAYAANTDQVIPRDQSPCGVVISRAEAMLFARPERYFHSLDGAGPPIAEGLYVPLLWDGGVVGVVWVLSHRDDRQFDAEDLRVLESLSRFASSVYRLLCPREEAPLRRNRERLRLALDTVPIGTWSFDLTTGEPDIDEGFIDLFELHSVLPDSYGSEIERRIPQEDLIRLYEIVAEACQSDGSRDYEIEHQAYHSDGSVMFLCTTVRVIHSRADDGAQPELIVGTVRDITEQKRFEEQLRASEDRFRAMVSQAMVAVAQAEVSGHLTFVNNRFAETLGYSPAELLGRHILEFTHPEDIDENQRLNSLVVNEGVPIQSEIRFVRNDGSVRWADVSASPILDVAGNVRSAVVLGTDITERKHAEEALRQSEARYRTLFESIDQGFFVADVLFDDADQPVDIYYLEANNAATRMLGQDYSGRRLTEIDPGLQDCDLEVFEHVAKTGESVRREHFHERLKTWFDFYIFRFGDADSRRIAVVFKDDTERKGEEELLRRSERDLSERVQEATAELRSLSRQLLNVQEAERRYLAHELHDEIGQALTGLNVSLEMALREQSSEHIERASEISEYLVEQVSALTLELRPPVLDDMGLMPALLALAERYQTQTGVHVELYHEAADRRFSGEVETAAYRIVQEALTNVARHSEADHVIVRVLVEESLQIWVIDSGVGFDVEGTRSRGQSLGFTGMQERASLAGGVLSIDSVPGEGTTVFAELPLEDDRAGIVGSGS